MFAVVVCNIVYTRIEKQDSTIRLLLSSDHIRLLARVRLLTMWLPGLAAMDQASVDRALILPVLWDPDSNELAIEAVRKYPDCFAIMGWFYLDEPNGPDLVAHWKERPGMTAQSASRNDRGRLLPLLATHPGAARQIFMTDRQPLGIWVIELQLRGHRRGKH